MLVIFISAIFILFIVGDITNKYIKCSPYTNSKLICNLGEVGAPFVFGLLMIGFFVLVSVLVVYFLISALSAKGTIAYST